MAMTFDEMSELTEELARLLVEESKHLADNLDAPESVVPAAFLFGAVESAINYFESSVPPDHTFDQENLREVLHSAMDLALSYKFGTDFMTDEQNLH